MNKQLIKHLLLISLFVVGCTMDILTKDWAVQELQSRGKQIAWDGYLDFTYTENHGMVFGFFNGSGQETVFPILLIMNISASLAIIVYLWMKRNTSFFHLFPFYIIQAGAVGNIIDKFRYGYVVDFIHIHIKNWIDWPYLFNIADALLCAGIGFLVLDYILNRKGAQTKTYNHSVVTDALIPPGSKWEN